MSDRVVHQFDFENSVGYWICMASHAIRRALSSRLAEEGITLRQWEVLTWLVSNSEISQGELAECMGIEPHTLAGVLRRMDRDGWVERTCCEKDRRRNRLKVTPKAEEVWIRARDICLEVRSRTVAGLSEEQLDVLKELCALIRDNLQASGAEPSDRPCETVAAMTH